MWGGKQLYAFIGTNATGTGLALTSNGTIYTFTIPFRCTPIRAGVTITQQVLTTSPVLTFGAAGLAGIITIPVNTDAAAVIYDKTDYKADASGTWAATLDEGDTVAVVLSVQASQGTGVPWLIVEINPDQPSNNSAMVLTA